MEIFGPNWLIPWEIIFETINPALLGCIHLTPSASLLRPTPIRRCSRRAECPAAATAAAADGGAAAAGGRAAAAAAATARS